MNLLKIRKYLILWMLGISASNGYDVPGFTPDQIVEYKQTLNSTGGAVGLNLHIFNPDGHQAGDSRPAIIFFFGGAWNNGSPSQFHPHCEYLAGRGMVAISAEYRVNELHGTSPEECVRDGKSAVRWLRENATSLGIDPDRIAASGGSAGGHIAAAAGTLANYEEAGENLAVSSKPNALVLFNPVYDNGPTGYAYDRVRSYWEEFSPLHNIDTTTPPTVVFLGTSDHLIPVATAKNYQVLMEAQGIRSDLYLYQNQPHGFFNYEVPDDGSGPWLGYQATAFRMDEFLVSIGYLAEANRTKESVRNWKTIFGDAGFSGESGSSASPVTTDADADAIAADIVPVSLNDQEYVRVTGTVTFDVPLTGGNFRVGLFDGNTPVAAGEGSGYAGIWAEAPATAATNIANGDGTGGNHPFETPTAVILGTIPGAANSVPASTPIRFSLMIARQDNSLDVTADFTSGVNYRQTQNLLNLPSTAYGYDRLAFLMTGNFNGTQANFENIEITSGPVLPGADPDDGGGVIRRLITFVDAVAGPGGNTFATGQAQTNTSWLINPGTTGANEDHWGLRDFGTDGTVFQALHNLPDEMPELTTKLEGLADGTYEIWAFYWDQVDSDSQNWTISTGLTSGALTTYSSPGEPTVTGAITGNVTLAADLTFSNAPLVTEGDGLRNLFGVKLGRATVHGGSTIEVFVDNLLGNGSLNRTWFDGVGYAPVAPVAFTPEGIHSFASVGEGIWELNFKGLAQTKYLFRSSTTLDFNSGTVLEDIVQGDAGNVSGPKNEIVTTDSNGRATLRVILTGGASDFVRAEPYQ